MPGTDDSSEVTHPVETPVAEPRRWKAWTIFVLAAGVILPVAAILFELGTKMCASFLFDPMPTYLHLVLLALVPIANLIVVLAHLRGGCRQPILAGLLVGLSVGITIVISVQFLPLLPFSIIGLIAMGMGLFGLSPFLALASSLVSRARLREMVGTDARGHTRAVRWGIGVGVLIPAILILSTVATNVGLRMASSADEARSARGVKLIRTLGSDNTVLRACYDMPTGFWVASFWYWDGPSPVSREDARTTYFKVTGRSFNSVPPPRLVGFRWELTSDFEFDSDVGGTAVNSRVTNLSMTSSRVDTVVDPDSMTAYTEWTLLFENTSSMDREARAEIALPPGGVVSRLTLWVNGEEREAAFAGRGKVREAYQKVAVVQRRDPVLVTTCGPDRVLMQCFPVPPNGGEMKVRVGITSPLMPQSYSEGLLILPRFIERNFRIEEAVKHSLFVESSQPMEFATARGTASNADGNTITVAVTDEELGGEKGRILCTRNSEVRQVWTPDRSDPDHFAVVQTLGERQPNPPSSVIIVLDGSIKLKASREDIAEAISALPPNSSFAVIAALDSVVEVTPVQPVSTDTIQEARKAIQRLRFAGGVDNRPALLKAYELAGDDPNAVILWIHGPQPFESNALTEQLLQRWKRRPNSARILATAAVDGRNNVLADLEHTGAASVLPRLSSLREDLKALFVQWNGDRGLPLQMRRERVPLRGIGSAVRGSSHIYRLWASDEVIRMCRQMRPREAAEFAAKAQLVTPVSGAVVLETEEQYREARLNPVDPASTPSIVPEPSSLLALAGGFVMFGAAYRRRRRPKPL